MENHHVEWENPLFLWSFSIANCNKLPEGKDIGTSGTLLIRGPSPKMVAD